MAEIPENPLLQGVGIGARPEKLCVMVALQYSDHISGLATYIKKYATPIICSPGTSRQLGLFLPGYNLCR